MYLLRLMKWRMNACANIICPERSIQPHPTSDDSWDLGNMEKSMRYVSQIRLAKSSLNSANLTFLLSAENQWKHLTYKNYLEKVLKQEILEIILS